MADTPRIEPWDTPAVRARKLGMTGPFTPAEYALITAPVAPASDGPSVHDDPDVIAARVAMEAAEKEFDAAHGRWLDAVATERVMEIRAHNETRHIVGGRVDPGSPRTRTALRLAHDTATALREERDEVYAGALTKARVAYHRAVVVAGLRIAAAEREREQPTEPQAGPEPVRRSRRAPKAATVDRRAD